MSVANSLIWAAALLAAVATLSFAALRGWRAWIELKKLELGGGEGPQLRGTSSRIEVADLKERVRSLEALARGVDL